MKLLLALAATVLVGTTIGAQMSLAQSTGLSTNLFTCNTSDANDAFASYISYNKSIWSLINLQARDGFELSQAGLTLHGIGAGAHALKNVSSISFQFVVGSVAADDLGIPFGYCTGPFLLLSGTTNGTSFIAALNPDGPNATTTGPDSNNVYTTTFSANAVGGVSANISALSIITSDGGVYYIKGLTINGHAIPQNYQAHNAINECPFGTDLDTFTYLEGMACGAE